MLKILYVYTTASVGSSSVQDKIQHQIKYLNEAGALCKGLFLNSNVSKIKTINENIALHPVHCSNRRWFKHLYYRRKVDEYLYAFLEKHFDEWDIIYIRYPGATRKFYKITKKYGSKIVTEHQSKELSEIATYKKEHVFGLKPSKLLSWIGYYFIPFLREILYEKKIVRNVLSIVAVTNEIAEHQKLKGAVNAIVCPNGIETQKYTLRTPPPLDKTIRIMFLKGTSSLSSWNGFDRLLKSIDKYVQSRYDLELIIVGGHLPNEIDERPYVKKVGYLEGEDLNKCFNEVHLGVSTLELYKKELNEAAVLKTREYFARGLPFIYAYEDVAFRDSDFALKFPNDNSLINFDEVINFVEKQSKNKDVPKLMRDYCFKYMDYKGIMSQLVYNLKKLNSNSVNLQCSK